MQAARCKGGLLTSLYTEEQFKTWRANRSYEGGSPTGFPPVPFQVVAKSIEVAIQKSQLGEGAIDLEDVCAIARLGQDKVVQAQRHAGSFDFADYIHAKGSDGNYVIDTSEQDFLKTWLSQIE